MKFNPLRLTLLLILSGLLFTGPAQALEPVSWKDLPGHVAALGLSLPAGVSACPAGLDLSSKHTRVIQWIENTVYKWREYPLPGNTLCVVMEVPVSKPLTRQEARVLLAASTLWTCPAQSASPLVLDPSIPDAAWAPGPDTDTAAFAGLAKPSVPASVFSPEAGQAPQAYVQTVFGTDDRTAPDTSNAPFNTIAYVSFNNGIDAFRGTAFLVSPYTALTNGHIVYDADAGQWYQDVTLAPGQYQADDLSVIRPFGERTAYQMATNTGYQDFGSVEYDYAAIFFTTPFSTITTYMPLKFDFNLDNDTTLLSTSGYPGIVANAGTFSQWFDSAYSSSLSDPLLARFYMDTSAGSSGSPVWFEDTAANTPYVVAINSSEWESGLPNGGPLLNSNNQALIESWLAWTPPAGTDTGAQATEDPDQDSGTGSIGQTGGTVKKYADPEDTTALFITITNDDGVAPEDIVQEWIVFGAKIGIVPVGTFFYVTGGDVVEFETGMDISALTYDFDHSTDTLYLTDVRLGDLDLSTQDSFWHAYMYATSPVTTATLPDIMLNLENTYQLIVN